MNLKLQILQIFSIILLSNNLVLGNIQEVSNYKNYYYFQRLDLGIYNDSANCYDYYDDDDYDNTMSIYYFIDCGCDMENCFTKLMESSQFMNTNYSEPDYNISKCIYNNYEYLGNRCIRCLGVNNNDIFIYANLYFYNYYCVLNKLIFGLIIFTFIIALIIIIVMKNEKKIIIFKKRRDYTPI